MTAASLDDVLLDPPGPAPVPGWPERIALLVGVLLFVAVALWTMWQGWRRHVRGRDVLPALPVLPVPPADLGNALAGPFAGTYLATTLGPAAHDPVVARGLGRSTEALLAVTDAGVYIERTGAAGVFIPVPALRGARAEQAAAGSVYGPGGVVFVTWSHGRRTLDTGFRASLPRRHAEVVDAVDALRTRHQPTAPPPAPATPEVGP